MSKLVLIWSNKHRAWWRPDAKGYSRDPGEAGIYDPEKAEKLTRPGYGGQLVTPRTAAECPRCGRAVWTLDEAHHRPGNAVLCEEEGPR